MGTGNKGKRNQKLRHMYQRKGDVVLVNPLTRTKRGHSLPYRAGRRTRRLNPGAEWRLFELCENSVFASFSSKGGSGNLEACGHVVWVGDSLKRG